MKKKVIYLTILLFVGTSLSPTIMGLVKNNPDSVNYIITEIDDYDVERQKDIQPFEEVCNFYDFKIKDQLLYDNYKEPIFNQGYFDFTLKGFITDDSTGFPIEEADILIISWGKHLSFDRVETTTDSTGYYEIDLEKIIYNQIICFVCAEGYFSNNDLPYLNDDEINWLNKTLTFGAPTKNSVVKGYVYNADNADPIEGAVVDINWMDNEGHGYWSYIETDDKGFFSVNVAAGEAMPWVYADNFYETYKQERQVIDGEHIEFNIHLYPRYPDSAMIFGYITEEQSGDPLENVLIELNSDNYEIPHFDLNFTFTDADGYYEIMVAESDFQINALTNHHANCYGHWDHIYEGETYHWDQTLYAIPSKTARIEGYITENNTNIPIGEAHISCFWQDQQGHSFHESTAANNLGYYKMKIAPGEISIRAYDQVGEHYHYSSDDYMIEDEEILLLDILLDPYPPKNSVVKGFIKSNTTTHQIIKGASVSASSYDEKGNHCGGSHTETDDSGYYEMNVAAGEVKLNIHADGYYYSYTEKLPIQEGETLNLDILIQPVLLNISVEKPKAGIYLNNQKLLSFIFPIIMGNIDIKINGSEELYEVSFYIDGIFKRADRFPVYIYSWNERKFGIHDIKLICNGAYDKTVIKNIRVLKLF